MTYYGWDLPSGNNPDDEPDAPANADTQICLVDVDDGATYIGSGDDGVYFDAAEGPDGWYMSAIVDSDTGHFVDSLVTDDGPYETRERAIEAGRNAAYDWCMNNDVCTCDCHDDDTGEVACAECACEIDN